MKQRLPQRIRLDFPVKVDGTEIGELTMRRPKVNDHLIAGKQKQSDAEQEIQLLANLCEVDEKVIGELDDFDHQKVQQMYLLFQRMDVTELRASIMALCGFTGWDLQTVRDMDEEDFIEWLESIPVPGSK